MSDVLNVGEFKVNFIRKKRVKNAKLKITKDNQISLVAPLIYPKFMAEIFINENLEWLRKKSKENLKFMLPKGKTKLLGKIYELKFDENVKSTQILDDIIMAKNEKEFLKFKKELAKAKFSKIIEIYQPLIGKNVNRLVIRDMKTRWGSCNSKKGYINLALNLVEKSPELIEYVILHELTHLLFPHHQKSFYDYIKNIMPDYKDRDKRLRN
ncbi:M48 family metallopeptidase [Campylobacter corcagiensis]|uniref:M48 family metallopeptidase n=1 Tax=Campylobacter corcagiensis TaxID=1448857 RepID=A0A7M1LEI0_9BACT|nr:SprT family zinc-dependent metalloprotease [Campylobacter corcagiensis]QKF65115.1 peptidase, M48 family (DUF45 domain) [Campylobacter corcagiensis]QOQ86741.1 M48 family metallopeptidase [Campylobacter corcagiensis]